jgi:hypothetical protein
MASSHPRLPSLDRFVKADPPARVDFSQDDLDKVNLIAMRVLRCKWPPSKECHPDRRVVRRPAPEFRLFRVIIIM